MVSIFRNLTNLGEAALIIFFLSISSFFLALLVALCPRKCAKCIRKYTFPRNRNGKGIRRQQRPHPNVTHSGRNDKREWTVISDCNGSRKLSYFGTRSRSRANCSIQLYSASTNGQNTKASSRSWVKQPLTVRYCGNRTRVCSLFAARK